MPRLVGSSDALSQARRRHRHARPRRNEARDRPAAHPAPRQHDLEGDRRGPPAARAVARAAAQGGRADRGARRLHERRKDDALQHSDRRRSGRVERALRHARSAGPPRAAAGSPRAAGLGHGRDSSTGCRIRSSRHSARRSRRLRARTCSSTSSTRRIPNASARLRP